MSIVLPQPKERNLFFSQQVNQSTIHLLSKDIVDINTSDQYLSKLYEVHDLEYKPKPIKIHIDSYGGAVYQCFGLLGIIKSSKTPIHTLVTGCAMSCGFLIAIAGHKRFAYDKSTYLYHQVSSAAWGTVKEMEESLIEAQRLQSMIEEHTMEFTDISRKKLDKVYKGKKDWFLSSHEALKLKVVDEII